MLDSLDEWSVNAVGDADLIALGWSDDALPDAQPRHLKALRPDQTLIHFSGALNAAELGQGPAETASLRPLAACPSPQRAARTFAEGPLVLGVPMAFCVITVFTSDLGARGCCGDGAGRRGVSGAGERHVGGAGGRCVDRTYLPS